MSISYRKMIGRIAVVVVASTLLARAASAADGAADPKTAWHGDFAAGLSITRGNSQNLTLNGSASATKLLPQDEYRLGINGAYGLSDWNKSTETVNAENIASFGDYKHLFGDRIFIDVRGDFLHDDVASVQNREIIGPALGYYFIKTDASRLSASAGGAYEHERINHDDENFFVVRFGERGERTWGKKVKIWEEVQLLPKVDDFANYLLISEAGVEVALTQHLALRVLGQDTYNSRPASGRYHNDLALITSIVWKY